MCRDVEMSVISGRSKWFAEAMKFSMHHRAFYCYLGMSLWIFFLVTVTYKYMAVGMEQTSIKKVELPVQISETDLKYRKIFLKTCNPPDSIIRGTEGLVDNELWLLQGALVVMRHGDRGPLNHLRGGDKIPCDTEPPSPLLQSYEEFVTNGSTLGRAWWVSAPGPFHNFPSLAAHADTTRCALGQLTPTGLLQMITVGNILRAAYGEILEFDKVDPPGKKDTGRVVTFSTRYRRTFASLAGACWGAAREAAAPVLARTKEAHSLAFCYRDCACAAADTLTRKIDMQNKKRFNAHPAINNLVKKMSKVLFESQEYNNAEVIKDAILAYMCHDVPLPSTENTIKNHGKGKSKNLRPENSYNRPQRSLLDVDIDTLNLELEYINNQINDKKAREIEKDDYKKSPLDFDAQMEREKLLYYQQRYLDNSDSYDDVVVVKRNLDADFNFPNDARLDFDEDYKEPTVESVENFTIKKEHVITLFAYLKWSYKQQVKNIHNRRRSLLVAYGLIRNIVHYMIKMISDNKPKFVIYSGHDKTLQPLALALGLNNYNYYDIKYASRLIFEVYRKKELVDKLKLTKRKPVAQDYYFRVVFNGEDVTRKLSFCQHAQNVAMKVVDPIDDMKIHDTYLCSIENIVRFIHDDYFLMFNASNYKDACASYSNS